MVITWEFKALTDAGLTRLVNLSDLQQDNVALYEQALRLALDAQGHDPMCSGYFVSASLLGSDNRSSWGVNSEHGNRDAIHAEESAGTSWRKAYWEKGAGSALMPDVLGLLAGEPDNPGVPCGGCRDFLRRFGEKLEVVTGSPQGGLAAVATLGDFLFDDYHDVDVGSELKRQILRVAEKYAKARDHHATPNVPSERNYAVMLRTDDGEFLAKARVGANYSPSYSIERALVLADDSNERDLPLIREVIVVRIGEERPDVLYRDRQALINACDAHSIVEGVNTNPIVYVATVGDDGSIRAWQTDAREWLPHPFSEQNFGQGFVDHVKDHYRERPS